MLVIAGVLVAVGGTDVLVDVAVAVAVLVRVLVAVGGRGVLVDVAVAVAVLVGVLVSVAVAVGVLVAAAAPQEGNLKVAMRVSQLAGPVVAIYSVVSQKVQLSVGSSTRLA